MGRVTFDHRLHLHPKSEAAGVPALGLLLCSITWSHFNDTDGFIPAESLHKLGFMPGPLELGVVTHDSLAESLITAGLWERTPGGFHVHDYADYQITRAERERRRRRDAERRKRVQTVTSRDGSYAPISVGFDFGSDVCASDHSQFTSLIDDREKRSERRRQFERLAEQVRGADSRSVSIWLEAASGVGAEFACAEAWSRLCWARGQSVPPVNEAAFVTAALRRIARAA